MAQLAKDKLAARAALAAARAALAVPVATAHPSAARPCRARPYPRGAAGRSRPAVPAPPHAASNPSRYPGVFLAAAPP